MFILKLSKNINRYKINHFHKFQMSQSKIKQTQQLSYQEFKRIGVSPAKIHDISTVNNQPLNQTIMPQTRAPEENRKQNLTNQVMAVSRQQGSLLWFIVIVICTAAIPILNIILFLYQPGTLSNAVAKNAVTTLDISNVWKEIGIRDTGRVTQVTLLYIVAGFYILISAIFIIYSHFLVEQWNKRFRMFFMVDNILICMIATNIAYAYLHIVCFSTTYKTDENLVVVTDNVVILEDILCILLYCITNLSLTGIFRILMVYVDWKPWQIIIYKMGIICSSMTYVVVGLIYLAGNDQVSTQIQEYQDGVVLLIEDLLWVKAWDDATSTINPFYLTITMYLDRMVFGIKDVQSTMDNFMLLFVFTNFGLSFEIIAKLTDFDGTADLKTKYALVNLQE